VFLPSTASGLPKDSTVNVSQLMKVDKRRLGEVAGSVSRGLMDDVDRGLRLVLGLPQALRESQGPRSDFATRRACGTAQPNQLRREGVLFSVGAGHYVVVPDG
jgi:hypothetical protein